MYILIWDLVWYYFWYMIAQEVGFMLFPHCRSFVRLFGTREGTILLSHVQMVRPRMFTFTVASHRSCDPRGCTLFDILIFDLYFRTCNYVHVHAATGSDVIIHHLSRARYQVSNHTVVKSGFRDLPYTISLSLSLSLTNIRIPLSV